MNSPASAASTDYELKYPLTAAGVEHVRMLLDALCVADAEHPVGVVSSLYFDTRDLQVLQEKLSGAALKHTYRLRWYGGPDHGNADGNVFLEVKQRNGPLRRKRRMALPLTGSQLEDVDPDSPEMISISHRFHELHCVGPAARRVLFPVLRIDYIRHRYVDRLTFGRCNLDLRITAKPVRTTRRVPIELNSGVFEYKGDTAVLPAPLQTLFRVGLRAGSYSKYAICSRLVDSHCLPSAATSDP